MTRGLAIAARGNLPVRQSSLKAMTLGSQAWFSAAASQSKGAENEEVKIKAQEAQLALVQKLKAKGLLQDPLLAQAFEQVNRGRFWNKTSDVIVADEAAYSLDGKPVAPNDPKLLPLDCAVDHAQQVELILPWLVPGNAVLDCGCGSGYLVALYASMVSSHAETGGTAVGVDRRGSLADTAIPRIGKTCVALTQSGKADQTITKRIITMPLDGVSDLPLPGGPFDAIRAGFSFPNTNCEEFQRLLDQLKPNGRLIAHIGVDAKSPTIFDKDQDGKVTSSMATFQTVHVPEVFERRVAVEGEDPESDAKAQAAEDERLARRSLLQEQLQAWRRDFETQNGRRPNRHDMLNDKRAAELFLQFNALNTGDLSSL